MYRVTLTNENWNRSINGPRSEQRVDGKYTIGKNLIPSFIFDIYPDNIGYSQLQPYISKVHIFDNDGATVFAGRIISVVPKLTSEGIFYKTVTCEGFIGYLNDSVFYYSDPTERTRQQWLQILLENHNNMVGEDKAITLKNFQTEKGYVNYEYNLERSTYGAMTTEDMLATGYTYEVEEKSDGSLVLECIHSGEVSPTTIELGSNLESISIQDNFDDICTRVIPLTEDGNYGIGDSPNGIPPYIDATDDVIKKYGVIMKVHKFEGITDKAYLKEAAAEWLKWNCTINATVTLTAVDLYKMGYTPEEFKLYNTYVVNCAPLNFNSGLQLTQITRDINDDWNVQLTFGNLSYRMSQYKT